MATGGPDCACLLGPPDYPRGMKYALFPIVVAAFLVGCATTPKDEQIVPFNREQARALFKNARPPQAFGLTVYTTERGPLFAGAHRVRPNEMDVLRFIGAGKSSAPIIGVEARGIKNIPALIDTVARENWITSRLAVQAAMTPLAGPNPYELLPAHVYDEVGGYAGLLHRLIVGSIYVENAVLGIRAAAGPMGAPARWHSSPAPEIVLGMPFLRAFSFVTIDFPARQVLFASGLPYPGPSEDTLIEQLPMLDIRGVIGVEGSIAGEPTTFLVDTGGDFQVAMNDPKDPVIRRMSLGDLVLRNVAVTPALDAGLGEIEYPRIGRGILEKYRITLDFRTRTIWFERPAGRSAE